MKNINIAISLVSIAIIAWLGFTGGNIQLHSLEIGYDSRSSKMWMHPIWLAGVPEEHTIVSGISGRALINTAIISSDYRGCLDWLIEHEIKHTQQFRALGIFMLILYPLDVALGDSLFNFEGRTPHDYSYWYFEHGMSLDEWRDMRLAAMWMPPDGWPNAWSFITLSVSP